MSKSYLVPIEVDTEEGVKINNVFKIDLEWKGPADRGVSGPEKWSEYFCSPEHSDVEEFSQKAKEQFEDFNILGITLIEVKLW